MTRPGTLFLALLLAPFAWPQADTLVSPEVQPDRHVTRVGADQDDPEGEEAGASQERGAQRVTGPGRGLAHEDRPAVGTARRVERAVVFRLS